MEQYIPTLISFLTLIGILWSIRDQIFGKGKQEQAITDRV